MRALPRATLALILGLAVAGASGAVAPIQAVHAAPNTASSTCGARVAILGADMSPGGRFEVQRALKVGAHTVQQDETFQDELQQAHGLIPPALLGTDRVAVSSALLGPLPAGSGLTVYVNPNILLDTAQTYANALLTAGVTDAEVRVAAPTSQKALGTTALLDLLRAANVTCLSIKPAQRDLAIREVVLADELAQAQPAARADAPPGLMNTLKGTAVTDKLVAPAALSNLITRVAAAKGVVVPAAQRQGLITFLQDLVKSGAYAGIAARIPHFTPAVPSGVHVALNAAPAPRATAAATAAPKATRAPATARSGQTGATYTGTVRGVNTGQGTLTVQGAAGTRTYHVSSPSQLAVTRNGQTSSLGALQPGDTVTLTAINGRVTAIDASSKTGRAAIGPATPAATAVATGGETVPGLSTAGIVLLAALVLLILLLLPLIVGLLRRRRERRVVTTRVPPADPLQPTERLNTTTGTPTATYTARRNVRRRNVRRRQ